jgi:exodeoxyribonuclease VII large subunit
MVDRYSRAPRTNNANSASSASGATAQSLPFADSVPRVIPLIRLINDIKRELAGLGTVTVEGEVYKPSTPGSGWTYFTLKDRNAQISVVVPANRSKFCYAKDGQRVAATGRLEYQSERGSLQFVASEVTPVGAGDIAELIKQRRESMRADGLLDRQRKPLPMLPLCVGILCGKDAAVRHDIEAVTNARFPGFPLLVHEVTVSGAGAVESILAGLAHLQRDSTIEVIIIARGGGDATQLLTFSDESLCREIAASRVPIVSAIGHDADAPLSDEVADHRAGTPSIAAAMVIPDRAALQAQLDRHWQRANDSFERNVDRCARRIERVEWQHAVTRLVERSSVRLQRVAIAPLVARAQERAALRLERIDWRSGAIRKLNGASLELRALHQQIEALSPVRVLERGYAIVRSANGVVRDTSAVAVGSEVFVTTARGELTATVSATKLENPFQQAPAASITNDESAEPANSRK